MGEEKAAEERKLEEVKKPAAEEEEKEEAPKAAGDGKKEDEVKAPPQEIVLKVFMHCEGCARKVRRCLKGFEGVENVITDCKTSKVVVTGEKAVPVKVLERVLRKCHRQVELISPIPAPEDPQKPPEKELVKTEEKKEEPSVITVVLGIYMHCDACAQEIRKRILRMKGIESAEANLARSEVTVKGVVEPTALAVYVYKKTGKHAAIVKVEPEKKEEEKLKEEKKAEKADQSKKAEEDGKENSGEAAVDLKMEVRKNEMYYYYPPQQNYQQFEQRFDVQEMNAFSDENPNACVVM
ncbi:heavy metal-associated isoprenylated plant protein 7-like [Salvia divinorum]|uniref:Heavy metal-associated isoprenylated plant protein 7-like n=1 Tax=Salvia divinorum TaxID=28513 RepID=A0ABD1IDQ4_SALDI